MAHQVLDRVQETTTSVGTGALTLAGATNRMLSLSGAGFANGDTFWGVIEHTTASEWEIALCTFSTAGPSITRATPLKSSNANATVAFSAGTKTVTLVAPATTMVVSDNNGDARVTRNFTVNGALYAVGAASFYGTALVVADSAAGGKLLFNDSNSIGQTWQMGPGAGTASPDNLSLYNQGTSTGIIHFHKNGRVGVGGVSTVAKVEVSGSDGPQLFGLKGTTKGLRMSASSAGVGIEGVDSTLVASYQPLYVNGSIVALQAGGTTIARVFGGGVRPEVDAAVNNGDPSYRWGTLYAATGTINTSGHEAKVGIREMSDAERRAAQRILDVGPKLYRFRDAVDAKGDAARLHAGYIAEDVRDALEAEGLDPWLYGFMCADEIMRVEEYTVTVERPKVRTVSDTERAVEIVDGQPVMVTREVTREEPVGHMLPVNDEKGEPIMVPGGEPDAEGHVPMVPLLHFVPETETVEETRTREVPTGERRLGLRYSELEAFLHAADATRGS